ncbi:MAG: hypothetical protein ACR2HF_01845 [Methylococcaceae bacterium]
MLIRRIRATTPPGLAKLALFDYLHSTGFCGFADSLSTSGSGKK